MKITVKDVKVKPVVEGVTIELSEMEAGFLRAICYGSCKGGTDSGFSSRLFQELDQYEFPSYDLEHRYWKVTKRARENW